MLMSPEEVRQGGILCASVACSYVLGTGSRATEVKNVTLGVAWTYEALNPTSTLTHFLQQGHIYSDNVTPSNSATHCGLSIQAHESMGALPQIQTTTVPSYKVNQTQK